jgi:hypothetical protein
MEAMAAELMRVMNRVRGKFMGGEEEIKPGGVGGARAGEAGESDFYLSRNLAVCSRGKSKRPTCWERVGRLGRDNQREA